MPCFGRCKSQHRHRPYFDWPNFSFVHDPEHHWNDRRHSTFSLYIKPKPPRHLRRHSLPNGTTVAKLPRFRKKHKQSMRSIKTVMTDGYQPPPGPPPSYFPSQHQPHLEGPSNSDETNNDPREGRHVGFAPSPQRGRELGPETPFRSHAHIPASQGQQASEAPPGYAPPAGPPPSWLEKNAQPDGDEYAPPAGPPPSHQIEDEPEPPPYDPWMAVPDNALLPPPPSVWNETSPTANASWDEAARAHAWCAQNPLWRPRQPHPSVLSQVTTGQIGLSLSPNTRNVAVKQIGLGTSRVHSNAKCSDTILLSTQPLYSPLHDSPVAMGKPTATYFELRIISLGDPNYQGRDEADAGIALGFVAPPYPSWRLPGWHRGSLGVHGDDGRRYIDNSHGGKDFTSAFAVGDTVGIGMNFTPPPYRGATSKVEVFFTRNGKRDGGWELHEERDGDEEGGDVKGLEGDYDLLGAVGCFGACEFEVKFRRDDWIHRP